MTFRPRVAALAIFLLALAVRGGMNVALVGSNYKPGGDALDYVTIADNLAAGRGYAAVFPNLTVRPTARRPPLFPLVLSGCFALFGKGYLVPRVLLAAIGAVTCVLLYFLCRRLFGNREALIAGLAAAALPGLWINNLALMSETLYVLLLVVFVFGAFIPNATSVGQVLACANNDRTYHDPERPGALVLDCVDPRKNRRCRTWLTDPDFSEADVDARRRNQGLRYMWNHAGRLPAVAVWRLGRAFDFCSLRLSTIFEVAEGRPPPATIAAALTPWLWGINGATSVLASVLSVAVALHAGIAASFWTGIACYLVAIGAAVWAGYRGPDSP